MILTPEERLLYADPTWRHSVPRVAADRLWEVYVAMEQQRDALVALVRDSQGRFVTDLAWQRTMEEAEKIANRTEEPDAR